MAIILSHNAAAAYWWPEDALAPRPTASRVRPSALNKATTRISKETKQQIFEFIKPQDEIDVLVFDKNASHRSTGVRSHLWLNPKSIGSLYRLTNEVFVVSPELCYLQMAHYLDFVEMVRLGYYLASSFAFAPNTGARFVEREAVCTTGSMRRLVNRLEACRGSGIADRALRWVIDGAASPMEVDLAMRLCLPVRYGGYGFSLPVLNRRINLPESVAESFGRDYYVMDYYWERKKVAVEYDSDEFHTGSARISYDAVRRNALGSMGIHVITMTRNQYFNPAAMDGFARELGIALHEYRRKPTAEQLALRRELTDTLFSRFS